jgi:hypothetical protein
MKETAVDIFLFVPEYSLRRLSSQGWLQFWSGNAPIEDALPAPQLQLLAVTCRDLACESLEPFLVDVDNNGYLVKKDFALPPLNTSAPEIVDMRALFISRYIRHAHQWRPPAWVLSQAIDQSLKRARSRISAIDAPIF